MLELVSVSTPLVGDLIDEIREEALDKDMALRDATAKLLFIICRRGLTLLLKVCEALG